MKKNTILHITSHLGGGVGRVLLNYFSKARENPSFTHKVACLDFANENAIDIAKKIGLELSDKMAGNRRELLKMIAEADVVLIHWWNHPLLYDFLVRTKLPPCRLAMWSHNAGFHPPCVFTKKILQYPDVFIFTTPLSLEMKEAQNLSNKQKKSLRIIWSTGGIDHVRSVKPQKHAGFNIGYIGTVDYAKLHPDFLNICRKIKIPGAKFIVCGGSSEKEIKKEAEKMGIAQKFVFTGQISDITKYLSLFDVFGYPLAPHHYGVCDQALQEAMASGIVPVVLANPMEKYMVKNGKIGIVAKNEDYYIKAVERLYKNKVLKSSLSQNARKHAIKTFSLNKMARDWETIFSELLAMPKTAKTWEITAKSSKISAADVFLESLGTYGRDFSFYLKAKSVVEKARASCKLRKLTATSALWRAGTRGTAHHYHAFFPKDKYLAKWSRLMK